MRLLTSVKCRRHRINVVEDRLRSDAVLIVTVWLLVSGIILSRPSSRLSALEFGRAPAVVRLGRMAATQVIQPFSTEEPDLPTARLDGSVKLMNIALCSDNQKDCGHDGR